MDKCPIDGHIQFNGKAWVFFRTKQENLQCETNDCSSCKRRSLEVWEKEKEDQAKAESTLKFHEQQADAALKSRKTDDKKRKKIEKAAKAKEDALKTANHKRLATREDLNREYMRRCHEVQTQAQEKLDQLKLDLDISINDVEDEHHDLVKKIEAKKWE